MKHAFALTLVAICLSGCIGGTQTIYYAEGVSIGQRASDFAACEAEALAQYPVRSEVRFRPAQYVPAQETCDAQGTCTTIEGYYLPPEPYTVDANQSPRRRAVMGCMGERGYNRLELPYCESGTSIQQSLVMAPLTAGTCLLRQDGPDLVVNPA